MEAVVFPSIPSLPAVHFLDSGFFQPNFNLKASAEQSPVAFGTFGPLGDGVHSELGWVQGSQIPAVRIVHTLVFLTDTSSFPKTNLPS